MARAKETVTIESWTPCEGRCKDVPGDNRLRPGEPGVRVTEESGAVHTYHPACVPVDLSSEPFRVLWTRTSNTPGLHGWTTDRGAMFATFAEAKAAAVEPFKAGVTHVRIDQAVNVATWQRNGRWQKLGERDRRNKGLRLTAVGVMVDGGERKQGRGGEAW